MKNNIKEINNLVDLYKNSILKYSKLPAFRIGDEIITYGNFNKSVAKAVKYFNDFENKNFQISIDNAYFFAVVYFAIVITKNVAVLCNDDMSIKNNKLRIEMKITEETIIEILNNEVDEDVIYKADYDNTKVATIVFSSGTTKKSKGIMLSMQNLIVTVKSCAKRLNYFNSDKCVSIIPLNHIFGLIGDFLNTFYAGGCICVLQNTFQMYSALETYKPNYLDLPPILVEKLLREIKCKGIDITGGNLRTIICGGATISKDIIQEYKNYNINICPCYGLTETLCISLQGDNETDGNGVGKLLDCNEVILDEQGQILVTGKNVMIGYVLSDESQFITISNKKYFKTKDIGYFDKSNNLIVVGRIDNIIPLANGIKITREIIEEKVNKLEGIKDSRVNFKDNKISIEIVAKVNKEIEKKIKQLDFGGSYIENIYYINEIKRNSLGKVVRNEG